MFFLNSFVRVKCFISRRLLLKGIVLGTPLKIQWAQKWHARSPTCDERVSESWNHLHRGETSGRQGRSNQNRGKHKRKHTILKKAQCWGKCVSPNQLPQGSSVWRRELAAKNASLDGSTYNRASHRFTQTLTKLTPKWGREDSHKIESKRRRETFHELRPIMSKRELQHKLNPIWGR